MRKFGLVVIAAGGALIALSVAPLFVYALYDATLGDGDGNPIGLGLLMVGGSFLGAVVMATGGILVLVGNRDRDR